MFIIMGIVIVSVLVLAGATWLFIKLKYGNKNKYSFTVHGSDGMSANDTLAVVKIDEKTNQERFFLADYKKFIDITTPTSFRNGKPYRDVMIDALGELKYLKGKKIDKELYKTLSLIPEEKSIALYNYKEYANRYKNPMDKIQAAMLFGNMIIALLVIIAVVYSAVALSGSVGDMVEVAKENQKVVNGLAGVSNTMLEVVTILTAQNCNSNINSTRQLS